MREAPGAGWSLTTRDLSPWGESRPRRPVSLSQRFPLSGDLTSPPRDERIWFPPRAAVGSRTETPLPPPAPRRGGPPGGHLVPDRTPLSPQKCIRFDPDATVWVAKQRILCSLNQSLKDVLNYGLFQPASNGRDGKFLDEERLLQDYPPNLDTPLPYLEVSAGPEAGAARREAGSRVRGVREPCALCAGRAASAVPGLQSAARAGSPERGSAGWGVGSCLGCQSIGSLPWKCI